MFYFSWDVAQKLVDILLKGALTSLLAVGAYFVSIDKLSIDKGAHCSGQTFKIFELVTKPTDHLDETRDHAELLIDLYGTSCGPFSRELKQRVLSYLKPSRILVAETNKADFIGWVVIGRVGGSFGQINFENAESILKSPPHEDVAAILKARWTVNVRPNYDFTDVGNNDPIDMLHEGECIKTSKPKEVRGRVWARMARVDCS
jgi:hypothetical protein